MSIKSKSRTLGRMIRRLTGLPLPDAMKIGKMVAQNKPEYDIKDKFPKIFDIHHDRSGQQCYSYSTYYLTGPKGTIEAEHSFNEMVIEKEFRISEALKKVPFGTTVSV